MALNYTAVTNPSGIFVAFVSASLAVALAGRLQPLIGESSEQKDRLGYIDGLRGFLAYFVFLHHVIVNFNYQNWRVWAATPSDFYSLHGEVGVGVFFMITGFLFWRRLIRGQGRMNWPLFFASRVLRLTPLYFFHVLLLVLVVFAVRPSVPLEVTTFLKDIGSWFAFSLFGRPDLAGYPLTIRINAGVTWTLAYEWAFYLALPMMGLMLRAGPVSPWLVGGFSLLLLAGLVKPIDLTPLALNTRYFAFFLGGIATAYAEQVPGIVKLARSRWGAIAAVCAMISVYYFFTDASGLWQIALLTVFFMMVALGNSIFGILASRGAVQLGHISYSVYLMHGMVLYTLYTLIWPEHLRSLSSIWGLWGTLLATGPVVVLTSALTYRYIERPFIHYYQVKFSKGQKSEPPKRKPRRSHK